MRRLWTKGSRSQPAFRIPNSGAAQGIDESIVRPRRRRGDDDSHLLLLLHSSFTCVYHDGLPSFPAFPGGVTSFAKPTTDPSFGISWPSFLLRHPSTTCPSSSTRGFAAPGRADFVYLVSPLLLFAKPRRLRRARLCRSTARFAASFLRLPIPTIIILSSSCPCHLQKLSICSNQG